MIIHPNFLRALDRLAAKLSEEGQKWYKDLKDSNQTEYFKLVRQYIKDCPAMKEATKALKGKGKGKAATDSRSRGFFPLLVYKEMIITRMTQQSMCKKKLMWEREYFAFAKKPKGGELTKSEMEANWAAWLADPSIARDFEGPRGSVRLLVKTGDFVNSLDELTKQKELEVELSKKKNASQADFEKAKAKVGQNDEQIFGMAGSDFRDLMKSAEDNMVVSKPGSRHLSSDNRTFRYFRSLR